MTKHDREIMEILEAFDLTACAHSAAQLAGVEPKTVAHYVGLRDAGGDLLARLARPKLIDPYLEKIEELVERSKGNIRADVVHGRHLVPMGFAGDERTTRRPKSPDHASAPPRRPCTRWPPSCAPGG